MIQHKHLIVNALIERPITEETEAERFLSNIVHQIRMKPIIKPKAKYVNAEGNRGMTACILIETSHIAFHIWDEKDPAELRFDLYTCGSLDAAFVHVLLDYQFGIIQSTWQLLDRESDITLITRQ
jgi:S-adenosylmethionine/arginine decarboxylase-like enzyme